MEPLDVSVQVAAPDNFILSQQVMPHDMRERLRADCSPFEQVALDQITSSLQNALSFVWLATQLPTIKQSRLVFDGVIQRLRQKMQQVGVDARLVTVQSGNGPSFGYALTNGAEEVSFTELRIIDQAKLDVIEYHLIRGANSYTCYSLDGYIFGFPTPEYEIKFGALPVTRYALLVEDGEVRDVLIFQKENAYRIFQALCEQGGFVDRPFLEGRFSVKYAQDYIALVNEVLGENILQQVEWGNFGWAVRGDYRLRAEVILAFLKDKLGDPFGKSDWLQATMDLEEGHRGLKGLPMFNGAKILLISDALLETFSVESKRFAMFSQSRNLLVLGIPNFGNGKFTLVPVPIGDLLFEGLWAMRPVRLSGGYNWVVPIGSKVPNVMRNLKQLLEELGSMFAFTVYWDGYVKEVNGYPFPMLMAY